MKKLYDLSDTHIKIIKNVMKENAACNTEAAALRYIIESYENEKTQSEKITELVLNEIEEQFAERLNQIEYAVKETEKKSHILIDVINTILFNIPNINHVVSPCLLYTSDAADDLTHVVSPGAVEHNVITESKQIHEKKLRKKKQYRDNRRENK